MLPFGESIVLWTLTTGVSALAGVALVTWAGRFVSPATVAAFAFGILLWFFVDTIQGSSDLLVTSGLGGGLPQFASIVLFIFGILVLFQIDRGLLSPQSSAIPIVVPLVAALALGIHGLGEGSAFGYTAGQSSSASVLDAFGGVSAGAAYVLHKTLEPMMAAALYVSYRTGSRLSLAASARDVLMLAFLFTLPSVVGAATGYYLSYESTYFFALGSGAAVYVGVRLLRQLILDSSGASAGGLKAGIAISLGFIVIYLAALLHS